MSACSLLGNIQSNTYFHLYTAVRRDEEFSEKVEVEVSRQLGGPFGLDGGSIIVKFELVAR